MILCCILCRVVLCASAVSRVGVHFGCFCVLLRFSSTSNFLYFFLVFFFFFQAEDGIRDAQESRGLGDVYKRQVLIGNTAKT